MVQDSNFERGEAGGLREAGRKEERQLLSRGEKLTGVTGKRRQAGRKPGLINLLFICLFLPPSILPVFDLFMLALAKSCSHLSSPFRLLFLGPF